MICGESTTTRPRIVRMFALALLAHLCTSANAADKVLVESVPTNIEKPVVLTIIQQALTNRRWTIVAQDLDSVSAKISRNGFDANIRIKVDGNRIVYEDSARGRPRLDYTGRAVPTVVETPSRWIDYLRSDISGGLHKPPEPAPALSTSVASPPNEESPPRRTSGVQRMQELKEMYERGLISADEYARKREQILKEL